MKFIDKVKLGLAGIVLAGSSFIGCNATPKGVENLRKYDEVVQKTGLDSVRKINVPIMDMDESSDNSSNVVAGNDNSSNLVAEDSDRSQYGLLLSPFYERTQTRGEGENPLWVRGISAQLGWNVKDALELYTKLEYDRKTRDVYVPGMANLDSVTDAVTPGIGARLHLLELLGVNKDDFSIALQGGLNYRIANTKLEGNVNNTRINEEMKDKYLFSELGVQASANIYDGISLYGEYALENHNINKEDQDNTNTRGARRVSFGVKIPFGGKSKK